MASVTSVQRLNTEGGNAPTKGCESQADAGKRIKEGYTADYVFFAAKQGQPVPQACVDWHLAATMPP